jgi:hypothetical protein
MEFSSSFPRLPPSPAPGGPSSPLSILPSDVILPSSPPWGTTNHTTGETDTDESYNDENDESDSGDDEEYAGGDTGPARSSKVGTKLMAVLEEIRRQRWTPAEFLEAFILQKQFTGILFRALVQFTQNDPKALRNNGSAKVFALACKLNDNM